MGEIGSRGSWGGAPRLAGMGGEGTGGFWPEQEPGGRNKPPGPAFGRPDDKLRALRRTGAKAVASASVFEDGAAQCAALIAPYAAGAALHKAGLADSGDTTGATYPPPRPMP